VVAIGYGGSELATRAIAALGALAAVAALVGSPPWWTALGIGTLLVAGVPLVYLLFVHPPLALIAIYAVAGVGIAAGVLSLLPSATRRWPLLALGSIGLLAWLFGAIALVLVFGPPLGSS
jgi:hypothetical protein